MHLNEEKILRKLLSAIDTLAKGFEGSFYGKHSIHLWELLNAKSEAEKFFFPPLVQKSKYRQIDLEEAIANEKKKGNGK